VLAKFREILVVSKQAINLRKLNELEVQKQSQINISSRFAALEDLSYNGDLNRAWENIKENNKITAKNSLGLYQLKQH